MEKALHKTTGERMRMQGIDLEGLKGYLATRQEVAYSFLYGSHAKGTATERSDVDVAVYFYPRARHPVEIEEEVFYPAESEIWGDLERISGREVELLVLNRAPAMVAVSAIKGVPLLIREWDLYLDFFENITDIAEEFAEFIITEYKERAGIGKGDQT
jgi:predicted nucleotidyltransferase